MRVLVIVKATPESEAGALPSAELLVAMGKFNEDLVQAGVMLAGEGLHPSAKGKRVQFTGDARTVVDGPFAETKELVAGFWLWQVPSMDEALAWVQRSPFRDGEVEIRPVFDAEDFGDLQAQVPEVFEAERRMRAEAAERRGAPQGTPASGAARP